MKLKRKQY